MTSTAQIVREHIKARKGDLFGIGDFPDLPTHAVLKTLSRMVNEGQLVRVSKGIYYAPRQTRFGLSHPSQADLYQLLTKENSKQYKLYPAEVSAANFLGFSTQNSVAGVFATPASSVPRKILDPRTRVYTNRPEIWNSLSIKDAALLDILRTRGKFSELSPLETKKLLLDYFRESDRFEKLVKVAETEPPRVQALLGAIGQEINVNSQLLAHIRNWLNPLSRFDFGKLNTLRYIKKWQGK
ncbi:MAG: DUF6088 family protein [Spirulina sp.]